MNKSELEMTMSALQEMGFDSALILKNYDYASAIVGVSTEGRVIYDYDKMIDWLITNKNFSRDDAIEWIKRDTLKALPYFGEDAPIVMFSMLHPSYLEEIEK